jgi:catechol 2,3-dioxygenase-like lactoylglutathione lyase family enzyme
VFSHIHVGTSDIRRAITFYDMVLKPLSIVRKFFESDRGWAGWKNLNEDRPLFLVGRPFDHSPASVGSGQMAAFTATSRRLVDRCHAIAIEAGAADEGAPALRPEYHANYYGAYFRDLDGNKVCVCCHTSE